MADIFEVMRQRIKNLEAELDATSTQLKAMTASKPNFFLAESITH